MTPKINIAIIGSTGFIGLHLLDLFDTNIFNITIISRSIEKLNLITKTNYIKKCADLNNLESLIKALENIDLIINLAAEVRNLEFMNMTNISGIENLVNAAILNKVKKIIHLSSVGVYGTQYNLNNINIDETTPCLPKNEYEKSKLLSENILLEAAKRNKFQLIILRPTNVFGENHPYNALLNHFQKLKSLKTLPYCKSTVFNYLYVKDLTACILFFCNKTSNHIIYNIGYAYNWQQFYLSIKKQTELKFILIRIPIVLVKFFNILRLKFIVGITNGVVYNDDRLQLEFQYAFRLEKGIKNTFTFFKTKKLIL